MKGVYPRTKYHNDKISAGVKKQWDRQGRNPIADKFERYLEKTYGLSLSEYDAMVRRQNGLCAICGKPPKARKTKWGTMSKAARLHVDHDHLMDRIRGLLCYDCNWRLGRLETEWAEKAMAYLKASQMISELDSLHHL